MSRRNPLLPLYFPWTDGEHRVLGLREFILSRSFSIVYITSIILIPHFFGFSRWGAITPTKLFSAPHEYLLSFLTVPFVHYGTEHITQVAITFAIFCQSFECRAGSKETAIVFFSTIAFTGLAMGLFINVGNWLSPETELFSQAIGRSWMGGSIGFFGILGAMSHHSRERWLIPVILVLFETWNHYENGMNEYINIGHLCSALFGFVIWGLYLKRMASVDVGEKNKSTEPEG
ncbi:MAG TPA: rhomboid family intramembrane serine protease [Candidatus Thalassarchaeaceae archaeon]|nr:rhomboid family intramembrane serine protease [Candidatus Thalassarchaeaceae archaeon]HJM67338.1 rhomboid family intramembrane serine protease [Candidatus Thalassarchaeaceae archaeon]